MYEFIPQRKEKTAKVVCFVMYLLSIVLFAMSNLEFISYSGIIQSLSFVILTAAILMTGKYLLKTYIYTLYDGEFIIEESTRGRKVTVCRLELSKLIKCEEWTADFKPPRRAKIYFYCVDMSPKDSYLLTFNDSPFDVGNEKLYIRISPDSRMISAFEAAIKTNAEERGEAYED